MARQLSADCVPAKVYELQRLRCSLCGKVFTAQVPQDVGADKYDITVASMIGLLKYGTGMPFNRQEGLQESLGVPLPASTQWKLVADAAPSLRPAFEELIRQGAQGDLMCNDDTANRIFDKEVGYVLKALAVIYKNDADARKQNLSPEARLQWHQAKSAPVMKQLHEWLTRQIEDRLVEPNSGLGQAVSYMLKHWSELTLFLRQAGAPLDNNVCERALKKVILHRKNAMFYLTDNGARVGDMYMSLIYTCQLCGANPFDYLTQLQRYAPQVADHPQNWMPWNYRQTIDGIADTTPLETIR